MTTMITTTTPALGAEQPSSLCGLRVLLVDDDPMNRTIMKFKLQKSKPFASLGLVCEEAATGEECLSQFHAKKDSGSPLWDLVMMDEHLSPDPCQLRGTQVIQLMRAAGYEGAVVSCSGNCTQADKDSYVEAGANAVWPKPFPTPEDIMRDLLDWTHAGTLVNASGQPAGAPKSAVPAPALVDAPASVAALVSVAALETVAAPASMAAPASVAALAVPRMPAAAAVACEAASAPVAAASVAAALASVLVEPPPASVSNGETPAPARGSQPLDGGSQKLVEPRILTEAVLNHPAV